MTNLKADAVDSKGAAIDEILLNFYNSMCQSQGSDTPVSDQLRDAENAKQSILALLAQEVNRIIGEDEELVPPKDTADHWGLTESGIERVLNNGKILGKNELRAEQRRKAGLV